MIPDDATPLACAYGGTYGVAQSRKEGQQIRAVTYLIPYHPKCRRYAKHADGIEIPDAKRAKTSGRLIAIRVQGYP